MTKKELRIVEVYHHDAEDAIYDYVTTLAYKDGKRIASWSGGYCEPEDATIHRDNDAVYGIAEVAELILKCIEEGYTISVVHEDVTDK